MPYAIPHVDSQEFCRKQKQIQFCNISMFNISVTLSVYAGRKPIPFLTEPTLQLELIFMRGPSAGCRVQGAGFRL